MSKRNSSHNGSQDAPVISTFAGYPATHILRTPEGGIAGAMIAARAPTPLRTKCADVLGNVSAFALAGLGVGVVALLNDPAPYWWGVAALGPLPFAPLMQLGWRRRLMKWTVLMFSPERFAIQRRRGRTEVYDRQEQHRFRLDNRHEEARREAREHEIKQEKARLRGKVIRPEKYYSDTWHLIFRVRQPAALRHGDHGAGERRHVAGPRQGSEQAHGENRGDGRNGWRGPQGRMGRHGGRDPGEGLNPCRTPVTRRGAQLPKSASVRCRSSRWTSSPSGRTNGGGRTSAARNRPWAKSPIKKPALIGNHRLAVERLEREWQQQRDRLGSTAAPAPSFGMLPRPQRNLNGEYDRMREHYLRSLEALVKRFEDGRAGCQRDRAAQLEAFQSANQERERGFAEERATKEEEQRHWFETLVHRQMQRGPEPMREEFARKSRPPERHIT